MTKIRESNEQIEKVEVSGFKIELPADINVEPKWIIDLSPIRQAMIYENMVSETSQHGVTVPKHTEYVVYVVSKKDMTRTQDRYQYDNKASFATLPGLKHYLLDMAKGLSVKRTTRKVVAVEAITDEDD